MLAGWDVLQTVAAIAEELGQTPTKVALAWVMARPGVTFTLTGASTMAQRDSNIAAGAFHLLPESVDQLCALSDVA